MTSESQQPLTEADKLIASLNAGFLAMQDVRKAGNYDANFLQQLIETDPPQPMQLDGRVRRATHLFVRRFWEAWKEQAEKEDISPDAAILSAIHTTLLTGYELGRKLRRPLTAKPIPARKDG